MNVRKFGLVNNDEGNSVVATAHENEGFLIPVGELPSGPYGTDEIFDMVSTAGGFLPRLQLFGGNSDAVKEARIPIAHYGLVRSKDQIEDLSPAVNLIPLSWRSKAMRLEEGNVVSVFNPNHPEFKKIMAESEEKDSKCLFGPEYLVWLLDQKLFATFLMGSKTARKESRHLKPLLGKAATVKVKLVSNKSYKWHSPTILPYSMPISIDMLPPPDRCREEAEKFSNPEETQVETVDQAAAEAAADRAR